MMKKKASADVKREQLTHSKSEQLLEVVEQIHHHRYDTRSSRDKSFKK